MNRTQTSTLIVALLVLLASACGVLDSGDEAAPIGAVNDQVAVDKLCAVTEKWASPLATAPDLGALAQNKVAYLQEARLVAPVSWGDNIDLILPAWQTLVEVIEAAEGDPSQIDFEKFTSDFAEATANDAALDVYTRSICPQAG